MTRRTSTDVHERIQHLVDDIELRVGRSARSEVDDVDRRATCGPTRSTTSRRSRSSRRRGRSRCSPASSPRSASRACSRRSAPSTRRSASTRRRARRCSARSRDVPQSEDDAVLSALAVRRREGLRPLDHGELPRVVRHVRVPAASCSTTRARGAARSSSRARSPTPSRASSSGCRTSCAWAISTRGATGDSPATTCARCG